MSGLICDVISLTEQVLSPVAHLNQVFQSLWCLLVQVMTEQYCYVTPDVLRIFYWSHDQSCTNRKLLSL